MNNTNRLHEILNRARISDDEIRGGIKLSPQGLEKVAARLGINSDEVQTLISALVSELRGDHERAMTEDDEPRYVYEADFLGNITIRDSQNGEEHYVGGSDAAHLTVALQQTETGSAEEQALLDRFCNQRSRLGESQEATESFTTELSSTAGSFNFPWRAGGRHGTGTAAYRSTGKEFDLQIIDVRDGRGEVIEPEQTLLDQITTQAEGFIGNA